MSLIIQFAFIRGKKKNIKIVPTKTAQLEGTTHPT